MDESDNRVPPRFGKKTSTKRKPTKRHLEDRLKSLEKDLIHYQNPPVHIEIFKKMYARMLKATEKKIADIKKRIEEMDKGGEK